MVKGEFDTKSASDVLWFKISGTICTPREIKRLLSGGLLLIFLSEYLETSFPRGEYTVKISNTNNMNWTTFIWNHIP